MSLIGFRKGLGFKREDGGALSTKKTSGLLEIRGTETLDPNIAFEFDTVSGINAARGTAAISFSRGTGAMQYAADGTVIYAPENLLPYSGSLNNGVWASSANVTVVASGNAATITESSGSSTNRYALLQGVTTNSVRTFYTAQIKAKQLGSARCVAIRLDDGATGGLDGGAFNLSTGVFLTTPSTTVVMEYVGQSATLQADGYWLITLTVIPKYPANAQIRINVALYNSSGSTTYTGDGSSGALVKEIQLERYSSARSYFESTSSVGAFGPRLDYDPSTLARRGLLVETSATNVLPYSDDFSAAYFDGYFGKPSDLAKNATGPDGVPNSAQTFTLGGCSNFFSGTGFYYGGFVRIEPGTQGSARTVSLWMKADAGVKVNFGVDDGVGTQIILTNQWTRYTFSGQAGVNNRIFQLFIVRNESPNSGLPLSTKIYVFGAQSEARNYGTSLIQTNGSSVTRGADIPNIPINSSWWNQNEGSCSIDVELSKIGGATMGCLFEYGSGSFSHWIWIEEPTSHGVQTNFSNGGNVTFNGSVPSSVFQKVGYGWRTGNYLAFQKGTQIGSSNHPVTLSVACNLIRLGHYSDGYQINGWIRKFKYWGRRIDDASLTRVSV